MPQRVSLDTTTSPLNVGEEFKKRLSAISLGLDDVQIKSTLPVIHHSSHSLNLQHAKKKCYGIDDVVVTPTYMEFIDGAEGEPMKQVLTLQNIGKKAAMINIKAPNSMSFEIDTTINGYRLCPGLSLSRVVRYSYKVPSSTHAMIPIEINGTTLDYHLLCSTSYPRISVEPVVLDFDYVDVGSVSDIKELVIENIGGKRARFNVDLGSNSINLDVQPRKGVIKANNSTTLKVQVKGICEGNYRTEFWIKSTPNISVSILVQVINSKITIDHPITENSISLFDFASTYLNTEKCIECKLKNFSSQKTSFIIFDDDNKSIQELDLKNNPTLSAFKIEPVEAILQPFEEITFSVTFKPTIKTLQLLQHQLKNKHIDCFVAVIKICKIEVAEAKEIIKFETDIEMANEKRLSKIYFDDLLIEDTSSIPTERQIKPETTIYLHGKTEIARLNFQPDQLYLGDLEIDEKIQRTVLIENPSKNLPLTFSFISKPCVRCISKKSVLKPGQIIEVLVTIKADFNLETPFKLEFDLWSENTNDTDSTIRNHPSINRCWLLCHYTPLKAHGKLKDRNTICKVSSGSRLDLEPDYKLTYTTSELELKMCHRGEWTKKFRSIFGKTVDIDDKNDKSYTNILDDYCVLNKSPKFNSMPISHQKELQKFLESKHDVSNMKSPDYLTPLQIFKIHVLPMKIDFGKMALKSVSTKQLTFTNDNDFPLTITLISLNPANIFFPNGHKIILKSKTKISRPIEFHSEVFGKFTSYINFVINNKYKYQLPIITNVVPKSLKLINKEINFESDCLPQEEYDLPFRVIEIRNDINTSVKFKWSLPPLASFTIEPTSGEIKGDHQLYSAAYPYLSTSPIRGEAILNIAGGLRRVLSVESARPPKRVFLATTNLDVGEIPLNRMCHFKSLLCNAERRDTYFEIDQDNLPRGMQIYPIDGLLQARSVIVLDVCIKFDACIEFDNMINIVIQKSLILQLKISGIVVFPKLKLQPSVIEMRRVSTSSYKVQEITATNLTCCCIGLKFLMDDYSEFRVSLSPFKKDRCIGDKEIDLLPQSSIKFYLHFTPFDISSCSFYLPMIINEILGPVDIENEDLNVTGSLVSNAESYLMSTDGIQILPVPDMIPVVHIKATVTRPIMCFNKLRFDFDNNKKEDTFCMCNNTDENLTVILIKENLVNTIDCPFFICCTKDKTPDVNPTFTKDTISCILLPSSKLSLQITYKPINSGCFICEIPINLTTDDEDDENEEHHNTLILSGTYVTERIETDILEIYLSPVQLKIPVTERFNLRVSNFKKSTSIVAKICTPDKLCGEFTKDTLKIIFPNGATIQADSIQEITVEIQLKSMTCISFRTFVTFTDIENTISMSITVYGLADDCSLSTHVNEKSKVENFLLTRLQSYPIERTNDKGDDQLSEHNNNNNNNNIRNDDVSSKKVMSNKTLTSYSSIKSEIERRFSRRERHSSFGRHSILATYIKDNSSDFDVTTKRSLDISIPRISHFPFFPLNELYNNGNSYMSKALDAIEKWLYSHVMNYQFNPTIADGITVSLSGAKSSDALSSGDKKNDNLEPCNFFDILVKLCDSVDMQEINNKLKESKYECDYDRLTDILKSYETAITYLMSEGACIAHVLPEFLVDFDDYITYKSVLVDEEYDDGIVLPEYAFEARSLQAWFDIIVQSYKCFVLNKIDKKSLEMHEYAIESSKNIKGLDDFSSYDFNVDTIVRRSKNYLHRVISEAILLAWLEYCHNQVFNSRFVNNFEDCLFDGLIFIGVTIYYCPFLKNEFFKNIILNPTDDNEKTHNIVCLIKAWKKIRLGFIITPIEILNANCIQMLILTVHLFNYLPTYLVKNKIVFSCPLTESTVQKIKLSITSKYQINYVAQFFENNNDLFSTKSIISINPQKNKQIKVVYNARKILNVKVYLVLCGLAIGPHFGENQVFVLEGFPSELVLSDTHIINSKLYQTIEKKLDVSLLCNYKTEYDIWISDEFSKNPNELKIKRWSDLRLEKVPRRLFINEDRSIKIEEDSESAELSVTITCITSEPRSFYVFFRSILADFIIQIDSKCENSITDHNNIELSSTEECQCIHLPKHVLKECPLNKTIFIQSKNIHLHNCLLHSFKKSLSQNENSFWSQHLNNSIGLRLINWMVKDYDYSLTREFKHVFDSKVTFHVTYGKKSDIVVLPRSVTIEDVQSSDDKIELNIHVAEVNPDLSGALVTLTSLDKKEIRLCKVEFSYESSTSDLSKSSNLNNNKNRNSKNIIKRI